MRTPVYGLEALETLGFYVLRGALPRSMVADGQDAILDADCSNKHKREDENGVIRLPMRYSPFFYQLLAFSAVTLPAYAMSRNPILHLQNAFCLRKHGGGLFQANWHRDYKRSNWPRVSVNVYVTFDDFTKENGALEVVPGSHNVAHIQGDYLDRNGEALEVEAGSIVVFDSALIHRAGENKTDEPRRSVNHQFTPHWVKQQIDYPRALGDTAPAQLRSILGYEARVPSNLDEFYNEPRLYKKGQE